MNSQELIASVKINGSIPESDQFNDRAILLLADETLSETLLPRILKKKQEYFVYSEHVPIIASKGKYRIPSRALNGVLRDVQLINGTNIKSLEYVEPETLSTTSPGTISAFYLESNSIMLYPSPTSGGQTLLVRYFLKPGKLIPMTDAAQILSINYGTNTLTLSSLPSFFSPGTFIDTVKGTAEYEVLSLKNQITSILGSDVTLDTLSLDLEPGDYLSPAGYSPFPNIPECFHPSLALFTAAKCLASLGQVDQQGAVLQRAEESLGLNLETISPRVQGEPQKIVSALL